MFKISHLERETHPRFRSTHAIRGVCQRNEESCSIPDRFQIPNGRVGPHRTSSVRTPGGNTRADTLRQFPVTADLEGTVGSAFAIYIVRVHCIWNVLKYIIFLTVDEGHFIYLKHYNVFFNDYNKIS